MHATTVKIDAYTLTKQEVFLRNFIDNDAGARARKLNYVDEKLAVLLGGEASSDGIASPFQQRCSIADNIYSSAPSQSSESDETNANELRMCLAVLARLAVTCPLEDVRERCAQLLSALEARGYEVPHATFSSASSFMPVALGFLEQHNGKQQPESQSPRRLEAAAERLELCRQRYLSEQHGRVENYFAIMSYHQRYVRQFLPVHNRLFYSDNLPLNRAWRHSLAVLACARYRCTYMVQLHIAELCGTERKNAAWLNGVSYFPPKLRELLPLNRLLAHQPWRISAEHLRKLLKNEVTQNRWSVSELIHAIVLMVHVHALASFAFACGVTPEVDFAAGHVYKAQPQSLQSRSDSPRTVPDATGNGNGHSRTADGLLSAAHSDTGSTSSLVDLPNLLRGMLIRGDRDDALDGDDDSDAMNEEQQLSDYLNVEIPQTGPESAGQSASSYSPHSHADLINGQRADTVNKAIGTATVPRRGSVSAQEAAQSFDIGRFVDDNWEMGYVDFMPRGRAAEVHVTKYQDFPWDYAVSLIGSRCDEVLSDDLAMKLRDTQSLTYEYVGQHGTHIDTTLFRRAIWCYVHCLFGIRHDDFDYSSVNVLLDRSLKVYIKMAVCFPDQVSAEHYRNAKRTYRLEDSEMVHINLMLIEAKMEAALVLALKALDQLDKQDRAF